MKQFLLSTLSLLCCTSALQLRGDGLQSATDFLLDAKWQIAQMDDVSKEVDTLAKQVDAGGDLAAGALSRLLEISAQPNAKWIIEDAGIVAKCSKLLSEEDVQSNLQRLAGLGCMEPPSSCKAAEKLPFLP